MADPVLALGALSADWRYVFGNVDYLLGGLWVTVGLTVASLLVGFVAGLPAAVVEVYGGRYSSALVRNVGVVLRGTPIVVIIMLAYFAFGISPAFLAATAALGFRSGAYQTQIFRGAIESVDGGQMEAARAVGLSKTQAVRHVVLPQALRRSVPGFQNEVTIVLKDTSIAFAIGLAELFTKSADLYQSIGHTTATFELIVFISAIYFALTFVTNRSLEALNDAVAIPGGKGR
ncbi:polar amino acid transport system permease protein [Halarchaeum rubridurum]|uniref:Amino acid ABC transporter permease n=1 Tax=Halarchaeum rubridurum TaxID=489911 RepID=A0A830FT55_9EURY|nr:amino acid ABC transporter permease [Halarchaeum rubridurum]MBP1953950.1 polar amino acid transport system permease protein [Halarchaeum rubridurum]GGM56132.1 amino acid ABC transporter permease [Halarchaeum rubridurum]